MESIIRIVIAVDFSRYSSETLEFGGVIAEKTLSEIIVLNVISRQLVRSMEEVFNEQHPGQFSLKKFLNDETGRRTRRMQELIREVVPESVPSRVVIRWGIPFEEIIKVCDNEKADLLVMAPHGESDSHRVRMGTTMEKCFRHSRTSLLRLALRQGQ